MFVPHKTKKLEKGANQFDQKGCGFSLKFIEITNEKNRHGSNVTKAAS